MIHAISFKGLARSTAFAYAAPLEFFKAHKEIRFTPGLNVLFGPNACGKSTLLNILARRFCAEQAGVPVVTQAAVSAQLEIRTSKGPKDLIGLAIEHDGQPITVFNTSKTTGLSRTGIDEDFYGLGLSELMNRESAGESAIRRMGQVLRTLREAKPKPAPVLWKMTPGKHSTPWNEALEHLKGLLAANAPAGPCTILLDEPDAHLSVSNQLSLWTQLAAICAKGKHQVIASSHSAFALGHVGATYFDMVEGFQEKAQGELLEHADRLRAYLAQRPTDVQAPKSTTPKAREPRANSNRPTGHN